MNKSYKVNHSCQLYKPPGCFINSKDWTVRNSTNILQGFPDFSMLQLVQVFLYNRQKFFKTEAEYKNNENFERTIIVQITKLVVITGKGRKMMGQSCKNVLFLIAVNKPWNEFYPFLNLLNAKLPYYFALYLWEPIPALIL